MEMLQKPAIFIWKSKNIRERRVTKIGPLMKDFYVKLT